PAAVGESFESGSRCRRRRGGPQGGDAADSRSGACHPGLSLGHPRQPRSQPHRGPRPAGRARRTGRGLDLSPRAPGLFSAGLPLPGASLRTDVSMKPKLCLAILGPTASGKSQLALSLARTIGGEILCLDSTTVYRGFDIGTGKPTEQDRQSVPHHLLDLLDPETPFSAHDFVRAAADAMDQVCDRGKTPLVVGGTYFYLRALQQGM